MRASSVLSITVTGLMLAVFFAGCLGDCIFNDGEVKEANNYEADGWIGAWGAAPQPIGNSTAESDQSFRMFVYPTIGGDIVRVRLSNFFGTRQMTFDSVSVAIRAIGFAGPAIMPGSAASVLFRGSDSVTISPGEEAVSDPVNFSYEYGDCLGVSFHGLNVCGQMTGHNMSLSDSYISIPGTGDVTADPTGASFTQLSIGWSFVTGIDVYAPESNGTIVCLGDSITDGFFEAPGTNTRWPDLLAKRLHDAGMPIGILNEGMNSNTVTWANYSNAGIPAIDRFDRDVLQRPGVKWVMIFEGTNDLCAGVKAEELHNAIHSLADRAHDAGLKVMAGTIIPRADPVLMYGWDVSVQEPERQKLNALIRADNVFDAVADFDGAMGSPIDPTLPNIPYYFPDLLHPTFLGFDAMVDAIPIDAFFP